MRISIGCNMTFDLPQVTPIVTLLNVHFSRASHLEQPDVLLTDPAVRVTGYRDLFGNWCSRLVAPPGRFSVGANAVIHDEGLTDPALPDVEQHRVEDLPAETLVYLQGSRYCDTDLLSDEAWRRFGSSPLGRERVQAICDFVHGHIAFGYETARPTRTASEAFFERQGVCRDFAHLAISFCRCLNIPARYCTGYLSDIGTPLPHGIPDFAAWIEVYLGGRWWTYDPRNNAPRIGRILIAQGRDAADVPLTQIFGPGELVDFRVWTYDIDNVDPETAPVGQPPAMSV
ncbi:MAG: transglutaminase family protein [Alphaproteobacteria bacterium]|nr:transglutaminase family protein [Alphaproteobacteria bacterium]